MATFRDANQVRLRLKMKLSQYAWYNSILVVPESEGYLVSVNVTKIDNQVRKLIPPVVEGVFVKTEAE
jgi:hypothetical protein